MAAKSHEALLAGREPFHLGGGLAAVRREVAHAGKDAVVRPGKGTCRRRTPVDALPKPKPQRLTCYLALA
jgi:hypothetical protein